MKKVMLSFAVIISLLFVISFASASVAVRLADHGTDVRNATDDLLVEGDLTITIYDAESGGNEIFSQTFSDGIVNGSWNVIVVADMDYGETYWKDYSIEGEDLDFSGNERLEFHSPLGYINNETFFNFSLIDSCEDGYAIKQINENGSVECVSVSSVDTQKSGDGYLYNDSSSIYLNDSKLNDTIDARQVSSNLSSYALKNESEVFVGNITTTQTGFFGWIGSLVSRVSKLFVADVDVSGNLTLNGTAIDDWSDVSGTADTQKGTLGNYVYNDSSNIMFNESELNATILALSEDTVYNVDGNYLYNNGSDWFYLNESKLDERILSTGSVFNDSDSIDSLNGTKIENGTNVWFDSVGVGTSTVGTGYILDVAGDARIQGNLTVTGELTQLSIQNLDVNGSVTPQQDAMFNIGNSTNRWKNGSFSGTVSAGEVLVVGKRVCLDDGTNCNYTLIESVNTTANIRSLGFNTTVELDSRYIGLVNESNLNVNSSGFWSGVSGFVSSWFYNSGNELAFNESRLNETIDSRSAGSIWENSSGNATFVGGKVGIGTDSPSAKLDVEVSSGGAATIGSSGNYATGNYAVAMGYHTTASGSASTAMGDQTTASGVASTTMGSRTTASGLFSIAMGRDIEAGGDYTVAIGLDDTARNCTQDNSMCIMGGNVGIGTDSPSYALHVVPNGGSDTGQFIDFDYSGGSTYSRAFKIDADRSVSGSTDLYGAEISAANLYSGDSGRVEGLRVEALGISTSDDYVVGVRSLVDNDAGSGAFYSYIASASTPGTSGIGYAYYVNDADFDFGVYSGGASKNYFGGSVGIGTDSPEAKLHIQTADSGATPHANYDELFLENSGAAGMTLAGTSYAGYLIANSSREMVAGMVYDYGDSLRLMAGGEQHVYIEDGGNVGIGTSSPEAKLHVYSGAGLTVAPNSDADELFLENSENAGMTIGAGSAHNSSVYFGKSNAAKMGFMTYSNALNKFYFGTNQVTRMVIDNQGKVGIGTDSPSYALHVVPDGTSGVGQFIDFNDANGGVFSRALYVDADRTVSGTASLAGAEISAVNSYSGNSGNVEGLRVEALGVSTGSSYVMGVRSAVDNDAGSGVFYGYYTLASSPGTSGLGYAYYVNDNDFDYGFYSGGTSKNYFGGNVGIGTSTPSYALHVVPDGTSDVGQLIDFDDTNGGVLSKALYVDIDRAGSGTASLLGAHVSAFNSYSGDSGIVEGLRVQALGASTGDDYVIGVSSSVDNDGGSGAFYGYQASASTPGTSGIGYAYYVDDDDFDFGFYSGGTSKNYFGGNVGIGTSTPGSVVPNGWNSTNAKILEIRGASGSDAGIILGDNANSAIGTNIWHDASGQDLYIDNRQSNDAASIFFRTKTAGTPVDALTILGSGDVGIGTSSPTGKLQVVGDEVRIGDAGTVNTADGDGDLYVEDELEVDNRIVVQKAVISRAPGGHWAGVYFTLAGFGTSCDADCDAGDTDAGFDDGDARCVSAIGYTIGTEYTCSSTTAQRTCMCFGQVLQSNV